MMEGIPVALCLAGAPTVPTPTATAPGATPTVSPPPGGCVGDCNDNQIVAVNELITGVNIALGSAPIGQCSAFDTNGNQMVDINELIAGVGALLNGCA